MVDKALSQAIGFHQSGQLQDAERLYRAILQIQPNHADANHNLGVLAVQVNQLHVALGHFKVALEANPNQGQFWLSFIDALIRTDQPEVARKVLEEGRQRGLQGDAVDALSRQLEGSEHDSLTLNVEYRHTAKETLPVFPQSTQYNKKKYRSKSTKPEKLAKSSEPVNGRTQSSQEINMLLTLFNERRFTEAITLARTMTERFPQHGFGWNALGIALSQIGRNAEALGPMAKAVELLPDDPMIHCNLGKILHDLERLNEAEASFRRAIEINPELAEALSYLGNTLYRLGRLDEAEAICRKALGIKANSAEAHFNLGVILHDLGRLEEALTCYRRALEIRHDYVEAQSNLSASLQALGRLDEAELNIRQLLEMNPDLVEAHSNLCVVLTDLGRLNEAEASGRRAIEIKPDFVDAYRNLGVVLNELGRSEEAEECYRRAIEIRGDSCGALNNLALLLCARGESQMALTVIKQSLKFNRTVEAKNIFVACAKLLSCTHDDNEIRATLICALTEPWGRPSDLARVCTDLIRLNPNIEACIVRASSTWPLRLSAKDLFGWNGFTSVISDPLLCALLETTPIGNIEIEHFLTMVRCAMLKTGLNMKNPVGNELTFYSALARQCFINEYVFSYTDEEINKASILRDALAVSLEAKTEVPVLLPVVVAAYFPLSSLQFAERLLDYQWPDAVLAVLVQQVCEPEEEQQLRASIPRLTGIKNKVSTLVQNQYEENPYPRWVKVAPVGTAKNFIGYLSQKFPHAAFRRSSMFQSNDVLIAGCGTGQHAIESAFKFQGAQVLAIDLSLCSLCYAKRKTQELGMTSIEYAQADLLNMGPLGRKFNVIESAGVLHHLADPWSGWQVLLSLLRPYGFMNLGFYSEVARRNVVRIRTLIAERGYGSTANEIRRCRQYLVDLEKEENFGLTIKSSDFFSISACRDLLFHVQEHCMTLSSIDSFLRANNLTFLGFEIDAGVLRAYRQRFPTDRAATNLEQWQIFENENPDTFFGMYQFWIQKGE